jgi:alpha-beta hydrolase superfamily lysophospholipase
MTTHSRVDMGEAIILRIIRTCAMNPSFGSIQPTAFPVRTAMGPVSGNLWRTAHPRASVLVVHGLGEHGGRYAAFASEVAEWGFTTAAVDWPGHGRSPGARGNASWCAMRDEIIPAALDALATEVSVPRLLVGHSMGGAMALDVALAHPAPVASVVACAPAVRTSPPQWWTLADCKPDSYGRIQTASVSDVSAIRVGTRTRS